MDINEGLIVDPAQRALAREAAKLLMPDPPIELVIAIEGIANEVREAVNLGSVSPTRADARKKLSAIDKHARALAELLGDPAVAAFRGFLVGRGNKPSVTADRMHWMTDDARALRDSFVPEGKGRHNLHDALGGARGPLVCAIAASRLSRLVRGREIEQNDGDAWDLCEAIWRAAGCECSRGDEDANAVGCHWQRHIRTARQLFSLAPGSNNAGVVADLMFVHGSVEAAINDSGLPTALAEPRKVRSIA